MKEKSRKKSLKLPMGNQMNKSQDRQYNDPPKRTNNDLQNIIQKTEDRETRTLLKAGVNSCASQELAVSAPHVAPVVLLLHDTNII